MTQNGFNSLRGCNNYCRLESEENLEDVLSPEPYAQAIQQLEDTCEVEINIQ